MAYREMEIDDSLQFPVQAFMQTPDLLLGDVPLHWHSCFELQYLVRGTAVQHIGDHSFTCGGGDIMLIRAGDIHGTHWLEPDAQIFVLKFMPSVIANRYNMTSYSKYISAFMNTGGNAYVHRVAADSSEPIDRLVMGILEEYSRKDAMYEMFVNGYIYELIGQMVRLGLLKLPPQLQSASQSRQMEEMLCYVEEHFSQELSLRDLSNRFHMNYSYTSRYFSRMTGSSFRKFLNYIRVCEASEKLVYTKDSIADIAQSCGFGSQQAFCRVFRDYKGVTPSHLRSSKSYHSKAAAAKP